MIKKYSIMLYIFFNSISFLHGAWYKPPALPGFTKDKKIAALGAIGLLGGLLSYQYYNYNTWLKQKLLKQKLLDQTLKVKNKEKEISKIEEDISFYSNRIKELSDLKKQVIQNKIIPLPKDRLNRQEQLLGDKPALKWFTENFVPPRALKHAMIDHEEEIYKEYSYANIKILKAYDKISRVQYATRMKELIKMNNWKNLYIPSIYTLLIGDDLMVFTKNMQLQEVDTLTKAQIFDLMGLVEEVGYLVESCDHLNSNDNGQFVLSIESSYWFKQYPCSMKSNNIERLQDCLGSSPGFEDIKDIFTRHIQTLKILYPLNRNEQCDSIYERSNLDKEIIDWQNIETEFKKFETEVNQYKLLGEWYEDTTKEKAIQNVEKKIEENKISLKTNQKQLLLEQIRLKREQAELQQVQVPLSKSSWINVSTIKSYIRNWWKTSWFNYFK
ncbi:MAG TPA: hypothetical protein VGW78_00295 [Candidatus Babeliales bacterium]|nr:hypothetical protein [Candidatus Babeliales bacterium]